MAAIATTSMADLVRRAQRLQLLTIIWMTAEAIVALASAWIARSPALLGFGGDSAIELLSAIVVLWRFRSMTEPESMRAEKTAARVAGALLFLVAVFVLVTSSLAFPIAAWILVPFIVKEGWEAIRASRPGCHCCSA